MRARSSEENHTSNDRKLRHSDKNSFVASVVILQSSFTRFKLPCKILCSHVCKPQIAVCQAPSFPLIGESCGILTSDIPCLHGSVSKQFKCRQMWVARVGSRMQLPSQHTAKNEASASFVFDILTFSCFSTPFYVMLLLSVNIFIISFIT